jgi:hypothetical protein
VRPISHAKPIAITNMIALTTSAVVRLSSRAAVTKSRE